MAAPEPPDPKSYTRVAAVIAIVALPWTWLLLPRFGSLGEMTAVAAPALFGAVVLFHLVSLAMRRNLVLLISALAWLASATVMIVSPRTPTHYAAPRDPVLIVAANVHFSNAEPLAAARDVVARDAGVIVISESTRHSEAIIRAEYPYWVRSRYHGNHYAEFVASRYPLVALPVPKELLQAVVVKVAAPAPFVLVGVHLPRAGINVPHLDGKVSFDGQKLAVRAVTRLTEASDLPVVVAGDLNVSDRTVAYRRLVAHRRDAMRAGWARATYRTFPWNLFSLRIDHVLIDGSWCARHARRFHPTGSDHDAVQVAVGPCA